MTEKLHEDFAKLGDFSKLHVYTFGEFDWSYTVVSKTLKDAVKALIEHKDYKIEPIVRRNEYHRFVLVFDLGMEPDEDGFDYLDEFCISRQSFKLNKVYC